MRRDWLYFWFTGFMTLWFAVIVPGHERGIVTLPEREAQSCCAVKIDPATNEPVEQDAPCGDPVRRCALCYIIGVLNTPPVATIDVPRLELVDSIEITAPSRVIMECRLGLLPQRAPPFA